MTGLIQRTDKITSAPLKDGTVISVNDHVYMASEFIGEPYYIGRIMEFGKQIKGKPLQVRIGWFYRPKDVMARKNFDSRQLIATMHSDMNPLSSIRGRCTVTHQAYIKDLDSYKKKPDHFYYNQLFDRYIHRFYDVLTVEAVRNLPPDVAKELARRYQYIAVEAGTASEYTDAHRICLICKRWCASGEALKCVMCHGFHHMLCINPPMLRKPSKGFAFQCALCTKLSMDSASSTPSTTSSFLAKQSSAVNNSASSSGQNSPRSSPKQRPVPTMTVIPTPNGTSSTSQSSTRSNSRSDMVNLTVTAPLTSQDQKMSHMWPFRYFGTHADIQDIFDPDDRVYPRASSRVGARYQAVVVKWDGPGHILATSTIFDDPQNSILKGRSRKGGRGGRPSNKLKVPEADQAEPRSRGHSASLESAADGLDTPTIPSSPSRSGSAIDEAVHIERGGDDTVSLLYSKPSHISDEFVESYMSRVKELSLPLPHYSADLIDRALLALQKSGFDADVALKEIAKVQKKDFEIRDWTPKEVEAFEEGIRLYGHELFAIKKNVETRSMRDIVRFFYHWKKTERYQPVYSVFTKIHKPNKKFKTVGRGAVIETASRSKSSYESAQDNLLGDESIILPTPNNATKFECAHCGTTSTTMWRRTPGEVDKSKEFPRVYCNDCGNDWIRYVSLPSLVDPQKDTKKSKNKDLLGKAQTNGNNKGSTAAVDPPTGVKRKRAEAKNGPTKKPKEQSREPTKSPTPPPPPPPPAPKVPCAVCNGIPVQSEQLLSCHECHLTVHRDCYGILPDVPNRQWSCDTCLNNHNPTCSTTYNCVLCTKTSDQQPQALKRTTGNNWAHILCSIWIPETTFVNVGKLSPIESIGRIRPERWKQTCSICKAKSGACVGCGEGCRKAFHVTCARDAGYRIAFEMQPAKNVKGGVMVPMIWCPNHDLTSRKIIEIRDQPDALTDRTALQTYAHYYKKCDTSVSSAMRKNRLLMALNPGIGSTSWHGHGRRASHGGQGSKAKPLARQVGKQQETCCQCAATISPIWWNASSCNQPSPPSATIPRIKLELPDDNHENALGALPEDKGEEEKHGQSVPMICHACFWDAKQPLEPKPISA